MEGIVKSAGRVMAILEAFDAAGKGMRISEIVRRLDIPQSSTSVLVKGLRQQGFLDYDPETKTYRPSVRVAMLGTWVLGTPTRSADILNLMRRLYEETGHSILLGIQNGLRAQYVSVLESDETIRFTVHPGTMRPIHRAAIGIMLLSLKSDEEIGRLLRHANAIATAESQIADEAQVALHVGQAREQGWFLSDSLSTRNSGVLAKVLPLSSCARPMAIGIGGLARTLQDNRDSLLQTLDAGLAQFEAAALPG